MIVVRSNCTGQALFALEQVGGQVWLTTAEYAALVSNVLRSRIAHLVEFGPPPRVWPNVHRQVGVVHPATKLPLGVVSFRAGEVALAPAETRALLSMLAKCGLGYMVHVVQYSTTAPAPVACMFGGEALKHPFVRSFDDSVAVKNSDAEQTGSSTD